VDKSILRLNYFIIKWSFMQLDDNMFFIDKTALEHLILRLNWLGIKISINLTMKTLVFNNGSYPNQKPLSMQFLRFSAQPVAYM